MNLFLSLLLLVSSVFSSAWLILQGIYYASEEKVSRGEERKEKISVVVAIKDEKVETVKSLVDNLSKLDYEDYEVIIVSDDSEERFRELLSIPMPENFRLVRRERPRGRKAGALNYGVQLSKGDYLVFLDAEARVEKDFLREVAKLTNYDAIALRLIVRNREGLGKIYSRMTDFSMASLFRGRERRGLFVFPNGSAFGIRKSVLLALGGWKEGTVTEDLEMGIRLALNGVQVKYFDRPTVSILSPFTYYDLYAQVKRWAYGSGELLLEGLKLLRKGIRGLEGFLYVAQWGIYSFFPLSLILVSMFPGSVSLPWYLLSLAIYGASLAFYYGRSMEGSGEIDLSSVLVIFASMVGFAQGLSRLKFEWRVTPKMPVKEKVPTSLHVLKYLLFLLALYDLFSGDYLSFIIMLGLSLALFELTSKISS
ncbi:MAG: family 2 glycosyl transferase [Candidatus Aramenus sulfurataquae]|uniref:Family 2 glycosyl transferase n=1 Tax=Candidatus Aramenus sulfurataquae TaxID=1326980 RepID=W7KUK6_9CREN|nr:MAG: family 2 glycosyl transferase [Candidatus Aramenus sulfurataquae]